MRRVTKAGLAPSSKDCKPVARDPEALDAADEEARREPVQELEIFFWSHISGPRVWCRPDGIEEVTLCRMRVVVHTDSASAILVIAKQIKGNVVRLHREFLPESLIVVIK